MKPVYLCNTVVNNWRKEHNIANTGHDSEAFELLTLSPTAIERLDEDPDEHSSFAGWVISIIKFHIMTFWNNGFFLIRNF